MNELKRANFSRFVEALMSGSGSVEHMPLELYVETSRRCNYRCTFCNREHLCPLDSPDGDLDDSALEAIEPLLPTALGMHFHAFGEPLMNKRLAEYVAAASRHGVYTHFNTNGELLTPARAAELMDAGLDLISLSLCTTDPALYSRLYPGKSLETVAGNFAALADLKRARCRKKPVVQIAAIMMKDTLSSIPGLVRFAANHQIEHLWFMGMQEFPGMPAWLHGQRLHVEEVDPGYLQEVEELGHNLGVHVSLEYFRDQISLNYYHELCPAPWYRMYLMANGNVHPCCGTQTPETPYARLADESPVTAWNSKRWQAFRSAHARGETPFSCDACRSRCLMTPLDMAVFLANGGVAQPPWYVTLAQAASSIGKLDALWRRGRLDEMPDCLERCLGLIGGAVGNPAELAPIAASLRQALSTLAEIRRHGGCGAGCDGYRALYTALREVLVESVRTLA